MTHGDVRFNSFAIPALKDIACVRLCIFIFLNPMNFWKFPEVGSFSIKKKDMLQISHYIEAKFVDTKKNIKKCQHFLECLQRILPKRDKGSFGKI